MTVPSQDLVPSVSSRVVTIDVTSLLEVRPTETDLYVDFILPWDLNVPADNKVIKASSVRVPLVNGQGEVRLPTYDSDAKREDGSNDWGILVKKSWAVCKGHGPRCGCNGAYMIRVPVGTSKISLADLVSVRPLTPPEIQWAITGAGISITQGSQWGASVTLDGGVLQFNLTVPPGGTSWWKGLLGSSANPDTLEDGVYGIASGAVAEAIGMPEALTGILESYQTVGIQIFHVKTTTVPRTWQRGQFSSGWTAWDRTDGHSWYRGPLDEQTGTLATLRAGLYLVRYIGTAEAWGLPQHLIGQLEVTDAGNQRQIEYRPNDAGAGLGIKSDWVVATDSNGNLRDRWQRRDKAIMRSSPVVLTAPAGDYTQVGTRGTHRLAFTVPTNVAKVRVHMRPWNYRTLQEWGPVSLAGVVIGQQETEGSGTLIGSQWRVPGSGNRWVTGAGWTSDWFNVGLVPGNSYLLSYGGTWQDESRGLVMGECWSHEDPDAHTSTDAAIYQNGWGGFALQPMDIWIECEAPSTVPVFGYFGASNTMGMNAAPAVYGAYPQLHARRNGAFCALTAAGGWSIVDASAHKLDITRRFGYPGRLYDRLYLDWGSNIAIRGASLADAQSELTRWMNTNKNSFGTPIVYMMTQIANPDLTETKDLAGTLSGWNEWIRYEVTQRDEVRGVIDFAAIFADPKKPWTARDELRASPGDVHFGTNGQRMRAQALDGEVHLPVSAARNASELNNPTGLLSAYLAARGA